MQLLSTWMSICVWNKEKPDQKRGKKTKDLRHINIQVGLNSSQQFRSSTSLFIGTPLVPFKCTVHIPWALKVVLERDTNNLQPIEQNARLRLYDQHSGRQLSPAQDHLPP